MTASRREYRADTEFTENMAGPDIFSILADKELADTLKFILEIGKLKSVIRQTYMPQQGRRENTAEHSWHLMIMAILLQKQSNEPVNIEHVLKMLSVHDLGEISKGDTIHYSKTDATNAEEKDFIYDLCSPLPIALKDEILSLWNEFESGETSDAKFARALDRFQPILYMLQNGGESWQRNKITHAMALKKNAHIADGSQTLWNIYQILSNRAEEDGLFFIDSAVSAEALCTLREGKS